MDQILDVTADGKIGVAVTSGFVTFDPVNAVELQHFVPSPSPDKRRSVFYIARINLIHPFPAVEQDLSSQMSINQQVIDRPAFGCLVYRVQ